MARKSTAGMRRIVAKDGRRFWIERATGKRTAPGRPLSAPQKREAGTGIFLTKQGTARIVGTDAGKPVYAPRLEAVRDERGKFVTHPTREAAKALHDRSLSLSQFRELADEHGLTERQLWSIYDSLYG